MSDVEVETTEKPFYVDRAKTGRAGCKKCKHKIAQGELRFAKLGHNPFGSGTMKLWHHIPCIFEIFKKQRPTTRKIESPDDIEGWLDITEKDRDEIRKYFSPQIREAFDRNKANDGQVAGPSKINQKSETKKENQNQKDFTFRAFRKLCADIGLAAGHNNKTSVIKEFFSKGSSGTGFKGDVALWCKMLLPGIVRRNYNIQGRQLVKIFSRIFNIRQEDMLQDLEQGDAAETISKFFTHSEIHPPASKSILNIAELDEFLQALSLMTREEEQAEHFKKIIAKCTANDLKMIIRLIQHDLRINAGTKHVLDALHPEAYRSYQTTRDILTVIQNALEASQIDDKPRLTEVPKPLVIEVKLMTPVLPMLAQICKSVNVAFDRFPNGMFSEIKYDGERVQVHKQGNSFGYFSRSLKPLLAHKVNEFKDYVPLAFPHGKDLIIDSEVIMVDSNGKPIPFASLGAHKRTSHKDAQACMFVFDCIYYNGESLLETPLKDRREILTKNMVEIKNRVMFSEMEEIRKIKELENMMTRVFKQGREGLVLKDVDSPYEPGKRLWLKFKKDNALGVAADTADLVVIGAWFGNGNKAGLLSSYLMGCYDEIGKVWKTVTRVCSGRQGGSLDKPLNEMDMIKISQDHNKVPKWLRCKKSMVPDFVARDPLKMPVWEITCAKFTCSDVHTAEGISMRFPRVTKVRADKDWSTATTLADLKKLYDASKNNSRVTSGGPSRRNDTDDEIEECTPISLKQGSSDNCSPRKKQKIDSEDTDTDDEKLQVKTTKHHIIESPLPDIFTGCVIQMPEKYKHNDFLKRYLIAYDAVLYDRSKNTNLENARQKVTHVVHVNKRSPPAKEDHWADSVRHVHINWVWDCIKTMRREKEKNYAIVCM